MRTKVSLLMVVKNSAHQLIEALDGVKGWADEIVIVDDESTDATRELAGRYTDKIFVRKWDLEGRQRNFAVSQASHDWVMWLDSDERITEELKKEIDAVLADPDDKIRAYWIPRKNYLGKKWLKYGGWYPAPHIKLYHKDYLKWREVAHDVVHPGVDLKEGYKGGKLRNHIIHYNFRDIEDFIHKVNKQSSLEALKWHLMGKRYSTFIGFWKGIERFWKRYVYRQGYKDGFYGFAAAFLSGFYQWAAYLKYREMTIDDPERFPGGPEKKQPRNQLESNSGAGYNNPVLRKDKAMTSDRKKISLWLAAGIGALLLLTVAAPLEAFLHKLKIKPKPEIEKLTDDAFTDYCTEAIIELIASHLFHKTSGFNPREYEAFKDLLRVHFDCQRIGEKRGLNILQIEDWID